MRLSITLEHFHTLDAPIQCYHVLTSVPLLRKRNLANGYNNKSITKGEVVLDAWGKYSESDHTIKWPLLQQWMKDLLVCSAICD